MTSLPKPFRERVRFIGHLGVYYVSWSSPIFYFVVENGGKKWGSIQHYESVGLRGVNDQGIQYRRTIGMVPKKQTAHSKKTGRKEAGG